MNLKNKKRKINSFITKDRIFQTNQGKGFYINFLGYKK